MNLAEATFKKVMEKLNPDDYNHEQFKKYNHVLYTGIIKTISECGKGPKELIDKLKAQIAVEDTDYTAIRNYARELEQRNRELVEALKCALKWIDSVPKETQLPVMPGFDRDYFNDLLSKHSQPTTTPSNKSSEGRKE